jgi:hypothetical protein
MSTVFELRTADGLRRHVHVGRRHVLAGFGVLFTPHDVLTIEEQSSSDGVGIVTSALAGSAFLGLPGMLVGIALGASAREVHFLIQDTVGGIHHCYVPKWRYSTVLKAIQKAIGRNAK